MTIIREAVRTTRSRGARLGRVLVAYAFASMALSGCYVLHLARGQLDLINSQTPLAQAIRDERDPARKQLLAEVPLITGFAESVIGMEPSESYAGYYAVQREWLTLVLSAAPKDALKPYTRWYPVAGRVPYRSYFDERRARRAQLQLEAQGYDTYLHKSPAYSTLGVFRDPVTTPMLDRRLPCPPPDHPNELDACRVAGLAETLIHELTHQHLYIRGKTNFNEQLASFVGRTGAIQYLMWRGLYDEALRARLQVAFDRQRSFEDYATQAASKLRLLYAGHSTASTKLAAREPIFAAVAQRGLSSFPDTVKEDWEPMNNARILQYVRYDRHSDVMGSLWKQAGTSWPRFWRLVQRRVRKA